MKYMNADEIKTLINEALSYGYHVAKDEAKGIRSYGYASIFFARHDIKQKLQQHGVMQGLPTEEDIRAAGLKLTAHLTIEPMLRDMAKRYFRQGARWAISNMSGSPTVGKAGGDASVSDGK
jgi:hypothetical protein